MYNDMDTTINVNMAYEDNSGKKHSKWCFLKFKNASSFV